MANFKARHLLPIRQRHLGSQKSGRWRRNLAARRAVVVAIRERYGPRFAALLSGC
jgi:hypothetical protein